jgi:hypothetical protein
MGPSPHLVIFSSQRLFRRILSIIRLIAHQWRPCRQSAVPYRFRYPGGRYCLHTLPMTSDRDRDRAAILAHTAAWPPRGQVVTET